MIAAAAALLLAASAGAPELAAFDVHLEGGGWTEADARELLAGIESLPPHLRRVEGGPLFLVRHAAAAPFGMGEWTDGHRRFHLYDVGPDHDRRAGARLQALDPAERARLWRRRAAVHAVLQRLDDARHLSGSARWRHAAGWVLPLERLGVLGESAENPYDFAFSRAEGGRSASLDLVTFAEELFVPPESVHPGAVPPDDRVRCQERTKSRALLELLGAPSPPPPCPAFDAFAAPDTVSHLEVWLAAATGREPESLFGHVMLFVARRSDGAVFSPGFQPVVQPVALTGSERGGLRYLWNGISGGFATAFLTTSQGDVAARTQVLEDRGIRRYRLDLAPPELERALERIWELERRGYPPYRFFTDNCATAILFLLQGALDDDRLPPRPGPYAFPAQVLDTLAAARSSSGGPLLRYVPDELRSSRAASELASARAREAARTLSRLLPPAPARAYARWHEAALSPEAPVRAHAQAELPLAVRAALDGADDRVRGRVAAALLEDTAQLVRAARYALDRLRGRVMDLRRLAALPRGVGGESAALARQRLFEREETLMRAEAMAQSALAESDALERGPHRPFSPDDEALIREERLERARFARFTALQAEVLEGPLRDEDAARWRSEDAARDRRDQAASAAAAREVSGVNRVAAGPAALLSAGGPARPALVIRTAIVAEDLGDGRLRGFGRSSELHLLDETLELAAAPPGAPARAPLPWALPEVISSRLVILGYRTLEREPPVARADALARLGWGAALSWEQWSGGRSRVLISGELLAVPQLDEGTGQLAALGVGASAEAGLAGAVPFSRAGPEVSLALRAPLGAGAALRLEGRAAVRYPGRAVEVHGVAELAARVGPLWLTAGADLWALEGGGRALARLTLERW